MGKVEKAAFTNGPWDELYVSKLDSGAAVWETGQKKNDSFVNVLGEITRSLGVGQLADEIREHEIEGVLQRTLVARYCRMPNRKDEIVDL